MMDRDKLQKRYLQDEWPRQVGNLASTLARLSSRASDARFDPIVSDLLHEGTLLMEWCAPNAPLDIATELASMQRELVLWRRIWPNHASRPLLAFRAREMADRLLEAAGF
jgi:hypothetical protein